MQPRFIIAVLLLLSVGFATGRERVIVVADSTSRRALPGAAVVDQYGHPIAGSDRRGRLPFIYWDRFPITISYLGYKDKVVIAPCDTILLCEDVSELPEVVVESRARRVLHILGYVREYSTLSTYTDTVFLFREKMVDFMLAPDRKIKFRGWSTPRVLSSKSYYRFTDSQGLDSVSNVSRHHFSWSDWMGIMPTIRLPEGIIGKETATDSVGGRYSPMEIWRKNNDRVAVSIDVLADSSGRKWVPNLAGFFQDGLDFERFRLNVSYGDVTGDSISPMDMIGYSFEIESNGRGHDMFMFNRRDEPFFVSTSAEVYIMDKEWITVKEARKWNSRKFDAAEIGIIAPLEAPLLEPDVLNLMARVDEIDTDRIRLNVSPDRRLVSPIAVNRNFGLGHRVLFMLKELTGISQYKSNKNVNKRWRDFRRSINDKNKRGN